MKESGALVINNSLSPPPSKQLRLLAVRQQLRAKCLKLRSVKDRGACGIQQA